MDSDGTGKHGGSPEEELNPSVAEALVEKPGRRQKLLGWLWGDAGGGAGAPHQYLGDPEECLQISTNLTLHLLELLALLGLCSRPLRAAWPRWACVTAGPLAAWAAVLSGCSAWTPCRAEPTDRSPLHFACLFGLLQALVLAVSLRSPLGMKRPLTWRGRS